MFTIHNALDEIVGEVAKLDSDAERHADKVRGYITSPDGAIVYDSQDVTAGYTESDAWAKVKESE